MMSNCSQGWFLIIFRCMVWCCHWWKSLHTPTDIMIESFFAETVCYHRVINRNPRSPKWGKDKKGKSQIFQESLLAASYIATLATDFFCRVEHSSLLFSRRRRVQPSLQTGQWWLLEHPMSDLTDFFFLLKKSAVMSSVFFCEPQPRERPEEAAPFLKCPFRAKGSISPPLFPPYQSSPIRRGSHFRH